MTDRTLFGGGILTAGVALIVAYMFWTSAQAQSEVVDGPGPNLVIDVAGAGANGQIVIDLLADVAPAHVERLTTLAEEGAYDNVVFHRVIDGFMAQTGDVQFGKRSSDSISQAGIGGSDLPDLAAEFSDVPFQRGAVGMARSASPDSANSQFFIMFAPATHLNGAYTVIGNVVQGMEVVDAIKRGAASANGAVEDPDFMASVTVAR